MFRQFEHDSLVDLMEDIGIFDFTSGVHVQPFDIDIGGLHYPFNMTKLVN